MKSDFPKYSGLNSTPLTEFVTESVFGRASGLYCKGKCEILWRSLFLGSGVECDGSTFGEGSSLYYK